MQNSYLKIKEIFCSIQGEGARVGSLNIFIRLSGCNKSCKFCDTDYENGKQYSLGELREYIQKYFPCKNIIWTGGEPCLQLTTKIINWFKQYGYFQAIEINETKFEADHLKLAQSIEELLKSFSLDELTLTMPYTQEEIENMSKLTKFDWEQFNKEQEIEKEKDRQSFHHTCPSCGFEFEEE